MKKEKQAFTLIELLVVIAIIGLLSTLSIIALNSARAKSRDAKRLSDVRQMQMALELYYNDTMDYPASPLGTSIGTGTSIFLKAIPVAPKVHDGSTCNDDNGNYHYVKDGTSGVGTGASTAPTYVIKFCLGADVGDTKAGPRTMTPAGIY